MSTNFLLPLCAVTMIHDTLVILFLKEKMAEFSIFPNNLVPQCRRCAPVKSEEYYCTENNSAMFIHPFILIFGEISVFDECYIRWE